MSVKYRSHYHYEEYSLWKGRWELIEGMPYAMNQAFTRFSSCFGYRNYFPFHGAEGQERKI